MLEYDNSTFFMIAGNDYVYATNGGSSFDLLFTSPGSSITAMALSNTTQEVIVSYGGVMALVDYNATYSQITSLVEAQSLAVYGPVNINDSPLNPILSFIPNQSYYDIKSIYRIFKNDSIHAGIGNVNSELLYDLSGTSGFVKNLLLDQVNQELYFLQSNNQAAPGTMVMKTSLSNFNPQMTFIIPSSFNNISDFKINPSSGLLYWSNTSSQGVGVYNYDNGTINHLVNNAYVEGFCFNPEGDLFYSSGSNILDSQGTIVFTSTSGQINSLEYSSVSNTFFFIAGNDYIFNSGIESGPIYDTGGSSIEAISLNETTQKVIFGVVGLTGIVDYDGSTYSIINLHGNNSSSIEAIN